MTGTAQFKTVIQSHLTALAEKDELFAETMKKPGKNIDECVQYILGEVQRIGANGFADEEIFGMAVHYYDEDNITIGKSTGGKVVINHSTKSQDDKGAAKRTADINKKMKERKTGEKPVKVMEPAKPKVIATSLFDM